MTDGVNYPSRKCLPVFSKPAPCSEGDLTASKTLARNIHIFWNILQCWAVINAEHDNDGDEGMCDFEKVIG